MLTQLILNNIHFILIVFAAFAFFTTGWLHLDSWLIEKKGKSFLFRGIGFLFLALAYLGHATTLELSVFTLSLQLLKILGLLLISATLFTEPILSPPSAKILLPLIGFGTLEIATLPISAILFLIIALFYSLKATAGYEKQIRAPAFAFVALFLAESLQVAFVWQELPVVFWQNLLGKWGPVWLGQHLLEAIGVVILLVWTWGYLRFRTQVQMFILTVAGSLIVFTVTTSLFTFLLLKNLENDAFSHLTTDIKVLNYALGELESKTQTLAQVVASDNRLKEAVQSDNKEGLYEITSTFLIRENLSSLVVVSADGEVLMRAEDKENIGNNMAENLLFRSAVEGKPLATIQTSQGIAPQVTVVAAAPITANNSVVGVIINSSTIDSAFVDGVKEVTSLDITVFAGKSRAATTFVAPDGKSRFLLTEESNEKILKTVLEEGKIFVGATQVLNQPFLAAYSPLKTAEGKTIGMLFVGKYQTSLIETNRHSFELTFLGSVILIILSVIPAYLFSRYLKENLEA